MNNDPDFAISVKWKIKVNKKLETDCFVWGAQEFASTPLAIDDGREGEREERGDEKKDRRGKGI